MIEFDDLLDRLKSIDEITLLELLEITSEDLVEAFSDKISKNVERVTRELE